MLHLKVCPAPGGEGLRLGLPKGPKDKASASQLAASVEGSGVRLDQVGVFQLSLWPRMRISVCRCGCKARSDHRP
jgi:hypothetical protein